MKKFVKVLLYSLIIIALSSGVTYYITTEIPIVEDGRVSLSQEKYNGLLEYKEEYLKVEELKEFIKMNYYKEVDERTLHDGALQGVFNSLNDPYSVYMNEEDYQDFRETSSGEYGGIGVIVTPAEGDYITVVSPIEDTPGERAGLRAGDEIIKVNGKKFGSAELDEAIDLIKGEPGTSVTLTIRRKTKEFDVEIVREQIKIKMVKSRMLDNRIGYIRITQFGNDVADKFTEHYEKLEPKMDNLIIDLRGNPGGSLSEVVDISDYILGKQMIVYTENREGRTSEYKSDASKINLPFVILVDGGSASASEILTGAAKDTNSGTIIGTTTFGKGLVQSVMPIGDGTAFKLTTSQYYTPNGNYIHKKGIEPDIIVEMPESFYDLEDPTDEEDIQLQKAIEFLEK